MKEKKRNLLLLAGMLILQIILSVWVCSVNDLHNGDEVLSYTFSNFRNFNNRDPEKEKWIDCKESLIQMLGVPDEDRFNYSIPYGNSMIDLHPPLYFFMLFTANSINFGNFTWWSGLIVNIICMATTSLFLFLLSKRLLLEEWQAFIPVFLWNLTGAMFSVKYLRMNAVLTTFSVAVIWYMFVILQEGVKLKRLIILILISFLGCMTQVLFVPLIFILTLSAVLFFWFKKEWKQGFMLGFAMLTPVILMIIAWPRILHFLFVANMYTLPPAPDGYSPNTFKSRSIFIIKHVEVMMSQAFIHNRFLAAAAIALLFCILICFLIRKNKGIDEIRDKVTFFIYYIVVFAFIYLADNIIAPDQPCQFFHYYPLLSLIITGLVLFFLYGFPLEKRVRDVLFLTIMIIFSITSFDKYRAAELTKEEWKLYDQIKADAGSADYALHIDEDDGTIKFFDAMDIKMMQEHDMVYSTDEAGLDKLHQILSEIDLQNGLAVYVTKPYPKSDSEQVDYMDNIMKKLENSGYFSEIDIIGFFKEHTVIICR